MKLLLEVVVVIINASHDLVIMVYDQGFFFQGFANHKHDSKFQG